MNNTTYLDSDGIVRQSSADHNFSLNLDLNTISPTFQPSLGAHHFLPPTDQRQDSMFHTSPQSTPKSTSAQYQFELQPCSIGQFERHSHNDYSLLPVSNVMSRSRSQFSSTSSGQYPYYHSPRRASDGTFGRNPASMASDMTRTYSDVSAAQYAVLQPDASQQCQQSEELFSERPPDLSSKGGFGYTNRGAMDPFHFNLNDIIGGSDSGNDCRVRDFGGTIYHDEKLSFPSPFSPIPRLQARSFGQHLPIQQQSRSSSHGKDTSAASDNPSSPSTDALDCTVHVATPPRSTAPDPVIGQVTLSGKFKCLQEGCHDEESLTFNRLADFKRHYDNAHLGTSIEYFCPQDGCPRSSNPGGGKSKGRSFKGRKDKMNEHLKTAHRKDKKKRKMYAESETEVEHVRFDEDLESKRTKNGQVYNSRLST